MLNSIGHYLIEAALGTGGMGSVCRAYDTRLKRTVALKFPGKGSPACAVIDEAARAQLLNEARLASALNHPHICTKSSNVIVTPEDCVKVLDFGLAKRIRTEELGEATCSRVSLAGNIIAGTLHYLAPELLRGEPADARSDLWALGVLLYQMAAGELPFQGRTAFEISAVILREEPPTASVASAGGPPGRHRTLPAEGSRSALPARRRSAYGARRRSIGRGQPAPIRQGARPYSGGGRRTGH